MAQLAGEGQKMPQVKAEMEQLGREIEYCFKYIEELEARLSDILQPISPTTEESKKDDIQLTPLATDLRIANRKVKNIGNKLQSIRNRLEL